MKFTISSNTLYGILQNNLKVIPAKATMPILDYFLFSLDEGILTITSSDLETTLVSKVKVLNSETSGAITVPSKLIIDSLRELSDQPITFDVSESEMIHISWQTGKLSVPGTTASGYPIASEVTGERQSLKLTSDWLFSAISKTIFAAADSELRPIMNGVYFDFTNENCVFVATDAHKLVKLTKEEPAEGITAPCSFILPKKPALLLKTILAKQSDDVSITFDTKNITFCLDDYSLTCRAIEGRYPNYNSVIPQNNTNKVLADRVLLLNSIKRVSVCSNQVSNLIKLHINNNKMELIAQDTDFSVSADDSIDCSYNGIPLELGFKSTFMIEMLSNMSSKEVSLEFADSTRAGLFIPYESTEEWEKDLVMLLMPIMS